MEIQTLLSFFKTGGFTVTAGCQECLKAELVDKVNEVVTRNKERGETEGKIKGIEARAKSYTRLVAKTMMEEARKRGLTTLDKPFLEDARKALGPMPPLD